MAACEALAQSIRNAVMAERQQLSQRREAWLQQAQADYYWSTILNDRGTQCRS
jgi:hypothetical protein